MSFRKKVVYVYSDIELVFWKFFPFSRHHPHITFRPKRLKISPSINILFFPIAPLARTENTPEKSA
ncbi:hypothetical protein GLS_c12630 [Gluconobacter oxydans DSM 3504]|uniref:Uncharacterized protein n=1 Tax=Gluconobacter oxydans DSM 3504 TaxID=1288313 RepID=A0A067Z681_GLUOY|nr:hypothetical protein GLS_c12630 [Gluconobacter oxydans DSM 3504]